MMLLTSAICLPLQQESLISEERLLLLQSGRVSVLLVMVMIVKEPLPRLALARHH